MADENNTPTDDQNGVTVHEGSQAATATIDAAEADAQRQAAEEAELIGGKFKTTDDLLEAYKNLEKKLGQGGTQEQQQQQEETPAAETKENAEPETKEAEATEATEENPYGEVVGNALKAADLSVEDVQNEFNEKGTLSEESFEAFDKAGFPRAMVEAYMRGVSEANNSSAEITEAQIGQIKDSVGGAEEFAKVQGYLASQATEAEVTAYNEAIGSGDFNKASKAVADAHAAYLRDIGSEGKMVGGKTAAAAANAYQSEAEMQADMRKPEYKTSQAFRDQVAQKLANSNLFQTR